MAQLMALFRNGLSLETAETWHNRAALVIALTGVLTGVSYVCKTFFHLDLGITNDGANIIAVGIATIVGGVFNVLAARTARTSVTGPMAAPHSPDQEGKGGGLEWVHHLKAGINCDHLGVFSMNLAAIKAAINSLMMVYQLISAISPLIGQIYDSVRALFPAGTPGAVKMDALKAQVYHLIAERDELKVFQPVIDQAWPMIKVLIESYHSQAQTQNGQAQNGQAAQQVSSAVAPVSPPAATPSA